MRLLALIVLAACGDPGPATFGDPLDDPQLPPRGATDLPAWIAAGYYQAWSCEEAPHPGRSPSPHGTNRICSNDILAASSGDGPYPTGAAGIKEVFNGQGAIRLYAVYRKLADGEGGATWYWFEGIGDDIATNASDAGECVGCHSTAPRDFVFTQVGP